MRPFAILLAAMLVLPAIAVAATPVTKVTITGPAGAKIGVSHIFEGRVDLVAVGVAYAEVKVMDGPRVLATATTDEFGAYRAAVPLSREGVIQLRAVHLRGSQVESVSAPHAVAVGHPPSEPQALDVVAAGNAVVASWSAPASPGSYPLEGYIVLAREHVQNGWHVVGTTTSTSLTWVPTPNTDVEVKVRAQNAAAAGADSNVVTLLRSVTANHARIVLDHVVVCDRGTCKSYASPGTITVKGSTVEIQGFLSAIAMRDGVPTPSRFIQFDVEGRAFSGWSDLNGALGGSSWPTERDTLGPGMCTDVWFSSWARVDGASAFWSPGFRLCWE